MKIIYHEKECHYLNLAVLQQLFLHYKFRNNFAEDLNSIGLSEMDIIGDVESTRVIHSHNRSAFTTSSEIMPMSVAL
jgi:hypothetical protein